MYVESRLSNFISLVKPAKDLATKAHKGVYRKGRDEKGNKIEYITHPEDVAKIVQKLKSSKYIAALIAAAYLHDTVEDTYVTYDTIRDMYGEDVISKIPVDDIDKKDIIELVVSLVHELTSDPEEIEKIGKEAHLTKKMLHMSSWALVIKLADRFCNLADIGQKLDGSPSDVRWAVKYSTQTKNIIQSLEENRKLSSTQKQLICLIKGRIAPALDIGGMCEI
ncbi:MAG: putative guanosine polyphosphate pyrophospho hydrolase/synthetase [uncultured marine phage]|uniref:Putative guanosine polyphosphate pyrophospho hydrolase/synthetase n=1 Tax=uncultured marine phage TaxID=707152 RepID=A0A8D9C8X9_9VIRU|nr:MAG: putative guanosine polyphosphate pyrophospho hydrolase/synthetase [uncultured marine phage]